MERALLKQQSQQRNWDSQTHDPAQDRGTLFTLFHLKRNQVPPGPVLVFRPDIHPTFIVACLC